MMRRAKRSSVIPAKAGIQYDLSFARGVSLDSRLRGNDSGA